MIVTCKPTNMNVIKARVYCLTIRYLDSEGCNADGLFCLTHTDPVPSGMVASCNTPCTFSERK